MAVESPALTAIPTAELPSRPGNMIAIDASLRKPPAASTSTLPRGAEEDLARLQDQLMDVLEENQQLRMELDAWRTGARVAAQQAC